MILTALASLNQTPLDWEGNLVRIRAAAAAARQAGVRLLLLPEMALSGYGCEDVLLAPHLYERVLAQLSALLEESRDLAIVVGLPLFVDAAQRSACVLLAGGRVHGAYLKRHLAMDGLHYEARWFTPWPAGKISRCSFMGGSFPAGDITFDLGGLRLGFEICQDMWVPERGGGAVSDCPLHLVLNPSASHFALGKHPRRRQLVQEGARLFRAHYLYANLLGNEAGRVIYDGALIAAGPDGQVLLDAERLLYGDHQLGLLPLDLQPEPLATAAPASLIQAGPWCWQPAAEFTITQKKPCAPELGHDEEFARAETLGLWDYMRKSRSRGFILSLSGGVDSAACAVLVRMMAERAFASLALAERQGAVPGFAALHQAPDAAAAMSVLLCCAYQATAQSGEVTRHAAEELARSLAADYHHFDVQPILEAYHTLARQAIGGPLSWEEHDIALQNIQARIRAPSVWMLANLRSALLITTSNRSEAAVGYATMDGDTAGSLSPLAGIGKAFLRQWLRRIETAPLAGSGPFPALRLVNMQAPTAELRPAHRAQTDEGDLMPYDVLDRIQKLSILKRLPPRECFQVLCAERPESKEQLFEWIRRFFTLWSRNQWKRERYAPAFHLDDESLDPKTWCRFPILSGSYELELRELRQELGASG